MFKILLNYSGCLLPLEPMNFVGRKFTKSQEIIKMCANIVNYLTDIACTVRSKVYN